MKRILILGGGTAGTIMANKLRKALSSDEWKITILDKDRTHYYQPGFLFIPFGIYKPDDVIKSKSQFIPAGVEMIYDEAEKVNPDDNSVLMKNGQTLNYDYLIVATGTELRPEETPGLKGELYYKDIFDFYSIEGAMALNKKLRTWEGGKLVVAIPELPYKCPVAPLEFVFLAEAYFTEKGIRDKVDLTYVTLMSGAFTRPIASKMLGELLEEKNINVVTDFYTERVDDEKKQLVSYDERTVDFDILTIVPVNKGSKIIENSKMGDDMGFVPTDKHTLKSEKWDNIFVLGDAANLPTSKAGSVAHFASDILFENLINDIEGRPMTAKFDGHANCYIETGYGKGALIDFNYDTEPLPGTFPLPGIGPFGLLKNTKINHYGKVMFRWMYWHILLKGKELPVEPLMTMAGKKVINSENTQQ
ncbi:MAG: sulfide:quinone oxidoreductase [Anaerophaga sp.]|jgi:sulfide:quinone oxidoreductase|uniref:type III sulfide quinone reductase, selenoprotein subtype n=1 Tax=Anaerophaga thermohalophila TaxID=177400 RepID=UPI000237D5F3|nr:FAD/NAD(P)-binding oxidoreductase [Anaerophaga thermohalophila]MDI3521798.1 sulfide:quinone oxidoreductase [Anaerophaga sp.]MDK2842644.1 sulfide:quinone oxidoreductase [Anaerophaga sp.]MDN5292039.1 sulfide:quinone oxidoreductase [Anaerophaga sp.]